MKSLGYVPVCCRDLSETAISRMPTLGLKELEILRLQDTESLKRFPSIYNFEVSFHCAKPHTVGTENKFTNTRNMKIRMIGRKET
jgi:hypothetical protein